MPMLFLSSKVSRVEIHTTTWSSQAGWSSPLPERDTRDALALVFADPAIAAHAAQPVQNFLDYWRGSAVLGCSTAGQFAGPSQFDAELVITLASFDYTQLRTASVDIAGAGGSRSAGRELGIKLARVKLQAVLVIGAGADCNGNAIAAGISEVLPGVPIVGSFASGLAHGITGVGEINPASDWVIAENELRRGHITGVGFLGDDLSVGFGSAYGWETFGPERRITRAEGNLLFELDNRSALGLYQEYLGDLAAELPASAMLFPLALPDPERNSIVRTVSSIDELTQGLRFQVNLVEGTTVKLMRAPRQRLIDSAKIAALKASTGSETLAVAFGGAGRRLVLGPSIDDELDAVTSALAPSTHLTGMYGHGELAMAGGTCVYNNQSMTVLTLGERGRSDQVSDEPVSGKQVLE